MIENDKVDPELCNVTDTITNSFYRSVDFENLGLTDIKEGAQTGDAGDVDATLEISFVTTADKFEQYKGLRVAHNVPGEVPVCKIDDIHYW